MNPWWRSSNEIEKDASITQWENSPLKYDPRIRHTFNYISDIVYSLRGPRQVGKTTLVKLQIRDFLSKGMSPWNIMYYSFDLEKSPGDIVDVIRTYQILTRAQRGQVHTYLFLDEITSVKDWQRGIKWLWDQHLLKNSTVVATGSQSMDIKASTERLPGRRGVTNEPLDKIMLPMKFAEYVQLLDPKLREVLDTNFRQHEPRLEMLSQLTQGKLDNRLIALYGYIEELNEYLNDYMLTGGIPQVVNEYWAKRRIEERLYTTYLDSILGQLALLGRDETFVKQLIGKTLSTLSWPVSWRGLQKGTDVGSVNTAISYITTLRDMFVLAIFYQFGEERKVPRIEQDKRIRFHDPFFLHVMNGWLSSKRSFDLSESFREDPANQGALVEGIVGDHLIRLAFLLSQKKQTFDYSNHVFSWRYEGGGELDYVLYDGSGMELPIEVRYQNKISKKTDITGIHRFQKAAGGKAGLLLTKDEFGAESDYVMVPTSMFLLLA
jgi:predicted AAA+ superfamily ATPase